ncbi:lipid-A-disaccharide synthase [Pseudoxanthomonas broegbernensis]|uniref:Lipid-A-disaccharide synthase n=1 Tax=Pseudoxanthomonas broegbernensis TaxID=83619 RepID=A0A7V8GMG9_9GAMM|nr:lipid-A-disaccharide synthase [Pseudoxanthomonas broegbernensis]KAF1686490.1 lipid-A-disaccharide synthase [Pseudoxanthomonas broegbernensis]MBB6064251.1 lipid-A-disaccharide synthase [Pseudoxanthomonas broegbernensis]
MNARIRGHETTQGGGPRFVLVAGEASGDALGAGLIDALRQRFPEACFAGIGGDAMRAAGMETWHDASELAVMGLAEVLRHLPRLLRLRREFRARALAWRPDVVVGIDAPDFNLPVERWFKRRGVATVHYVSPSVWAWREKRAEKIGASADRVLCLFPMEPEIYARHGVDARFVGHPMADALPLRPDRAAARASLGLPADAPVLAVLPGSRLGEIERLGEIFFEAAWRASEALPALHVVAPAANGACRALMRAQMSHSALPPQRAHLLDGQARAAMAAADVVLLASGTATLEAMLCKRPMVVGYRVAPLTYRIVRALGLLKVDRYALPNVLAGEDLAPELMQDDCTPDRLAAAVLHWFQAPQAVAALQPKYLRLHEQLRRDASASAAEAIATLPGLLASAEPRP